MISRAIAIRIVGYSLALFAAFLIERFFEFMRNGYVYLVTSDKTFASPLGDVHLRHVCERGGWVPIDTGKQVIALAEKFGSEIKLYEVPSPWRESSPWIDDVRINGNRIEWSDGRYRYETRIERVDSHREP